MYSEQLEQLIKSVIADGVITEKERAVLHKKAASEGVDEDEIDVYVDGLVAQMKPSLKSEPNIDMRFVNKSVMYVSVSSSLTVVLSLFCFFGANLSALFPFILLSLST